MASDTTPDLPTEIRSMLPSTSSETTTAVVHYYRAEVQRMTSWRNRLDQTSNWAITVTAALLSVSLSTPTAHHGVLIFALLLVTLLLYVEGRRYRFYDVYRMRVRQFERHYFAPLFAANPAESEPWLVALAQDLRHPRFRIGLDVALTRRLRRNYVWLYLILLLAWVLKIASPMLQEGHAVDVAQPLETIVANAALGPVPGWLVLVAMLALGTAIAFFFFHGRKRADDDEVHM